MPQKRHPSVLLQDNNKTYRLCNFFIKTDRFAEGYIKFMFPDFRFRASSTNTRRMNEISFHYDKGVITFKHKNLYADKLHYKQNLDRKGFLPLFIMELADLSRLTGFQGKKSKRDIMLDEPWAAKPRGFIFFLSKRRLRQLAIRLSVKVLGIYDIHDIETRLFLKIVDCQLPSKNIPRPPIKIRIYEETATIRVKRIREKIINHA